jgi:hypothetical protein
MHNLDLIGSFIVGGLLLAALLGFTLYFNASARTSILSQIEQSNITEFGRVIEYDFHKMGYRVTGGDTIISFDSTAINFRADLDNNGTPDSIQYWRSGLRPNFLLNRHTSIGSGADFTLPVKNFTLTGYDTIGNSTNFTDQIHSIEFKVLLQKDVRLPNHTNPIGVYWIRRFFPKNL